MLLRFGVVVVVVASVGLPASADAAAQPQEQSEEGEEPEGVQGVEGGEGEQPSPFEMAPAPPAKGKSKAKKRGKRGRVGHVVREETLRRRLPPPPSGNLHLYRPLDRESLKVNIYNPDGSYNAEAIRAASHMLRCRRSGTEKEVMEPRLLTILSHVFDHFGERRIDVVSGFRNQRKTSSYHYKGSASDIRVEGVSSHELKAFVETLDSGGMGIGIYPVTGFVHIDVRPPPSYRWIDYSPSNPDAGEKKPPPWVKKRRRVS